MGADMNQALKAIAEAEAYPGPSLIIGYSPCEMHSIKGGMAHAQEEMKKAARLATGTSIASTQPHLQVRSSLLTPRHLRVATRSS